VEKTAAAWHEMREGNKQFRKLSRQSVGQSTTVGCPVIARFQQIFAASGCVD
jgi:hypothetical protein